MTIPADDVSRGTSPPVGGLAATDLADWRTVAEAATEIGCSKRTIERLAASRKVEQRLRPQAGSPAVAVYNPDDVARIASERRPAPAPFVLPPVQTPANGNGHAPGAGLAKPHFENAVSSDALIRGLAVLLSKAIQSPPSSPVAEKMAETSYVTIPEAAALVGLSVPCVRRLIKAKGVATIRDGAGLHVRRTDLEQL